MMADLDKWVSNLYFEIGKVNLMDIKIDDVVLLAIDPIMKHTITEC